MKFSFKSKPGTTELSPEKRAQRARMLQAVPDELLAQIRGGLVAGCHPPNCLCCCGGGTI
ncbi:MAG TPA: hypothetical protein VNM90_00775 [Haliangium sp.]|nr:hypothetical protein [Haliangium sp.]